jgi:hypothetical protein
VTQGHDPGQSGADLAQARARIEQLTADLAAERTARQVAEAKVALMAQNLDDLRFLPAGYQWATTGRRSYSSDGTSCA